MNYNEDTIIYGKYDPYKCNMSISSTKYKIDKEKKIIYVNKDDSIDEIKKNIQVVETLTVTKDTVTVECKELKDEYKIERYWTPKTGQTIIRYGLIIGIVLAMTIGLIYIINKIKKD